MDVWIRLRDRYDMVQAYRCINSFTHYGHNILKYMSQQYIMDTTITNYFVLVLLLWLLAFMLKAHAHTRTHMILSFIT